MNADLFAERMRNFEYYHNIKLVPEAWIVLRIDGRSFSRFTESNFEKPFDDRFHELMLKTSQALLQELQGCLVYTASDEISVLLSPSWALFDRELEKIVSISASIASATFTHAFGTIAHFDSRIWVGLSPKHVIDYFLWRQADVARCALYTCAYWTLRNQGISAKQATAQLSASSVSEKHELLFSHGMNYNELPTWQRRGVVLFWEEYEKEGFNPLTQESVQAARRRIQIEENLPMKQAFADYLQEMIACIK